MSLSGPDLIKEANEVKKIYGLYRSQITAPEGYEFTGEFRCGKEGELYLSSCETEVVTGPLDRNEYESEYNRRLILRKKIEPQPAKPVGYTAAEVIDRYGKAVLGFFIGRNWKALVIDREGFRYTGRLEHANPGDWFLDCGPIQNKHQTSTAGNYLTLIKLPQPTPRIITFYKKDAKEFVHGEAAYLPNEKGEMFAVDRNEAKEEFYWERQEVA